MLPGKGSEKSEFSTWHTDYTCMHCVKTVKYSSPPHCNAARLPVGSGPGIKKHQTSASQPERVLLEVSYFLTVRAGARATCGKMYGDRDGNPPGEGRQAAP